LIRPWRTKTAFQELSGRPAWIAQWKPERVICGYDADRAGNLGARSLERRHGRVERLRPEGRKGWNDILRDGRAQNPSLSVNETRPRQGPGAPFEMPVPAQKNGGIPPEPLPGTAPRAEPHANSIIKRERYSF